MNPVISKSLHYIFYTLVVNIFFCFVSSSGKEILIGLNAVALLCAVPALANYHLSNQPTLSSNFHLKIVHFLLTIFNLIALLLGSFLLPLATFYLPTVLLLFPYVINGWWVYSHFAQNQTESLDEKEYFDEEILDDGF